MPSAPNQLCLSSSGPLSRQTGFVLRLLSQPFYLVIALAVLLAPALWNGFALTFYDTGGYIEAVARMRLVPGRSLFYGFFLQATSLNWWSLWGPIMAQSLAVLWVLHLLLRCHGLPAGAPALAIWAVGLGCLSGIGWYTAQLMPDILVPLLVLCLWLLGLHRHHLSRPEQFGLAALALVAVLSHMSCLALALGLVVVLLIARMVTRRWPLTVGVALPAAVVAVALAVMPLGHLFLTGTAGLTPGGPSFLFGRLVQDGVIQRWLADHCPVADIRLCELQHRLPATADEFLWTNESPFQDLGGWTGAAEPELKRLALAAVTAYPGLTLWTTLRSTAQQLVKVATGDALDEGHYDTFGSVLTHLPHLAPSFFAARQQQEPFSSQLFATLNLVHVPVGLAAFAALLPMALWARRHRRHDLAALARFTLIALLGNGFICGALSNPHDRYQSRLIWLAPLVITMMLTAIRMQGQRRPQAPGR